MDELFLQFDTDKSSKHHNYARQYESLFEKFKDVPEIRMLEIGVFKGQSLKAWRSFFNSGLIVGIDINEECKQYDDEQNGIRVEIGDSNDAEFVKHIHETYGPFDIILDDGSHRNIDVIRTFETLFPLLKNNGLYIVEDTNCFKIRAFIDSSVPDHLNYFAQFIPPLNQSRYDSTEDGAIKDYCTDPFKIMKKANNVFEASIDKIEFGCGYIAISKLVREHWIADSVSC
jgi:hypothetical protein